MKYKGLFPDKHGKFGIYGGKFAPEILMPALNELSDAFTKYSEDPDFWEEYNQILSTFSCRPTPLYFAKRLSEEYDCKVYLKREDLNHGGSHKLNNSIGQALLAKRIGKTKLICETGAGMHGY